MCFLINFGLGFIRRDRRVGQVQLVLFNLFLHDYDVPNQSD